jgi:hypothetical protein
VTCGDVGLENAVVVPRALFPIMLAKVEEITKSKAYKSGWLSTFGARTEVQGFLVRRCSKEVLKSAMSLLASLLAAGTLCRCPA